MANPVEQAVNIYIRAASEQDLVIRAGLLEQCFAEDGRMVTRGREIRGRQAISDMLSRFWSDPENLGVRVVTAIDAKGTTFRFGSVADRRDGTVIHGFDAGEIDADGRISLILVFAGLLV